ncbi:MAG: methionine biosynthesis protein MetW [Candidatus Pacebacteria bacterium]|nr:methionine biosynthesis protein MetW [Candidatus Paceibacterota bacterium]
MTDLLRQDLALIADLIPPGVRLLDIGCGDGALLEYLGRHKNVDGRGIELSQKGVNACVARGLAVVQGDADRDLQSYPTHGFDVVVLSQTLQATRHPDRVVAELVRIGKVAIVSLPNFGRLSIRMQILFGGKMPRTNSLSYEWYDTPNIHLCTLADFYNLLQAQNIKVESFIPVSTAGRPGLWRQKMGLANLLADQGIFRLSRQPTGTIEV